GEHQAINLAAAIAAAELAPPIAERLSEQVVRDAVAEVRWPGRMELIPGKPDILLDGAHNPASIERLIAGIAAHFPDRPVVFVFGAAEDKNIRGMLAKISGTCWPVIFTPTQSPRSAQPGDLEAQFAKCKGRDARAAADIREAITEARAKAGAEGLIVITGSLYLVGEAKVLPEQNG
ncbi:MAG: cyanophycin synthetase, partial [Phycisphaerae bacterium]|nr:cyanophycin synthetase [Phycisphaerae bacterium]